MIRLDEIQSSDWQLSLDENATVVQGAGDINQSIQLVLSTERGSDPLRPEYGIRIGPIDRPVNIAAPEIVQECIAAIQRWERRAIIETIGAAIEGEKITVTIRWRDARGGGSGATSVTL